MAHEYSPFLTGALACIYERERAPGLPHFAGGLVGSLRRRARGDRQRPGSVHRVARRSKVDVESGCEFGDCCAGCSFVEQIVDLRGGRPSLLLSLCPATLRRSVVSLGSICRRGQSADQGFRGVVGRTYSRHGVRTASCQASVVLAMSTSQGACLVTSAATEPSTRVTPWTRRLPTTIVWALSRFASSQIAAAGLSRLTVEVI